MVRRANCPTPGRLRDLLDDPAEPPDVLAHLAGCDHCRAALAGLSVGRLDWLAAPPAEAPAPAELRDAIDRLKRLVPGDESAVDPGTFDFLAPPDEPGHLGRIGPYPVLGVLGRGGAGIVFQALDRSLGRVVAVKVLAPQLAANGTARQRFLREGRAAAAVAHEHVVTVHAVDEAGGLPFLVMEYVPGATLQEVIDKDGPLDVRDALRVAAQVADGLAAAHRQGLIHRDVKPANILLENRLGRARLSDFGLARAADDAGGTHHGTIAGTPEYMAPEQARGDALDGRADLFALGCVLYAALTGRSPFRAGSALAALHRVASDRPAAIRSLNPAVPPDVEVEVMALLAKNPADRPAAAERVADRLRRCLVRLEQPTWNPPRRRSPWRGAAVAAVVVAAAVAVGVGFRPDRAPPGDESVAAAGAADEKPVAPKLELPTAVGLLPPAAKGTKSAPVVGGVRFAPAAVPLVGGGGDVFAVAVSLDGARVAAAGGGAASGFLVVLDVDSKKELFATRLSTPVMSVAYSPDGKHLAYATRNGTVRLVAAAGGEKVFELRPGGGAVVCFAPDGRTIATATDAKVIQIWDVPTGEEVAKIRDVPIRPTSLTFAADGKRLAVGGGTAGQAGQEVTGVAGVWDVATGRLVTRLDAGPALVLAVAFSPDGATLAAGGADDQIRVWDVPGGQLKTAIRARQGVFGLAFAPDGMLLAAATLSGSVGLYTPATGAEAGELAGHPGGCRAVAFAAGGKKLVTGGSRRTVKLWDVPGKRELATLRQDEAPAALPAPLAVAGSPDGALVALATEDKGVVLRDARTGDPRGVLTGHDDAVTCVAFSPDGKVLATGSADKAVKLWDIAGRKELHTLKGHTNWVYAVAFSPDGKTLATGAYDKSVRLWDAATGRELHAIEEAHRGSVRAVAFSPDGKTVASGGSDRAVKLWAADTREARATLKGHAGTVRAVAFGPDGKTLASASDDTTVRLWDVAAGTEAFVLKGHTDEVACVGFAGPATVVSGGADGTVRQWDAATGKAHAALSAHPGGVTGLVIAPDGTGLVSAGQDKTLKRWRADTSGPVRLYVGHTGAVHTATYSPDGQRIVSCGGWPHGDQTVRVWDAATGKEALKIDLPRWTQFSAFSPDGKSVLAGCDDNNAHLLDAATGAEVRLFRGHTGGVTGVAFSADGRRALTTSQDKTVRLWDTATGTEVKRFEGHTAFVRRAVFHPDGKHALSGGRDGFVRMWELDTAREVRQFRASGNWADALALSPDGKHVAVASKTSKVYEVATGKHLLDLDGHPFGATGVSYSPDGKSILTAGYDGAAKLWDATTGRELYAFRGHGGFLWSAVFSPDGRRVLTSCGGNSVNGQNVKGEDFTIRLWAMPDARALAEYADEN